MRPLVRDGGVRTRQYPANRVRRGATPAERIARYILPSEGGCWIWTAWVDPASGYGRVTIDGQCYFTHRVAYEAFVGPIPKDHQIDHLCRVRACCNPAHLEPVTPLENTRRSPINHYAKTVCPRNHPYDESNTYAHKGRRYCRTCQSARRQAMKELTATERQARKAAGLPLVDLDAYFAEQEAAA